jgi:hypothetical protein
VANVGKNIAYLSASASRAALHNSLALSGNLADVTAKAGSQTILASMLGTGVGCLVSPIIGTEWVNVAAGFTVCSVGHLGACWWSLKGVALKVRQGGEMGGWRRKLGGSALPALTARVKLVSARFASLVASLVVDCKQGEGWDHSFKFPVVWVGAWS